MGDFYSRDDARSHGATHKIHRCYTTTCRRGCIRSCFIYMKNENGVWYDLRSYKDNPKRWWPGSGITGDYKMSMDEIVFEIDVDDKICYEFMVECGKGFDGTIGPPCGGDMECYDVCMCIRLE